ncbi:phage portal protein [Weissella cibaria]|uniref:phage portal protein n=1 Tax=Weissella cibaria TaxID=137591 RepID=UPI0034E861E5
MDQDELQPMSVAVAGAIFKQTDRLRFEVRSAYRKSLRYYKNQNDITLKNQGKSRANGEKKDESNPLRQHDSRVSSNFHQLLVDQKASYTGSIPPEIDTDDDKLNMSIMNELGAEYPRTLQRLMVNASLAGIAWLHIWNDAADGSFKFAIVPPDEVTPIYNNALERKLQAVRRTYTKLDPQDGEVYIIDEYWTASEVSRFKRHKNAGYESMIIDDAYQVYDDNLPEQSFNTNVMKNEFGAIPFIPFPNDAEETPDLDKYKGLIDGYDLVFNGFINDVEDVQQIIFVLTNYGSADLGQFRSDLKKYKAINMENDGDGDPSGVSTLKVDIPVEARNSLLTQLTDNIFLQGQGVNPTKLELGNNSGVALKYLYSLLELKASKLESEFRPGVEELVRFVMRHLSAKDADTRTVKQTWKRAAIQNDVERADVAAKVATFTSDEALAKANPIVDDWSEELKLRQAQQDGTDDYANETARQNLGDHDDNDDIKDDDPDDDDENNK